MDGQPPSQASVASLYARGCRISTATTAALALPLGSAAESHITSPVVDRETRHLDSTEPGGEGGTAEGVRQGVGRSAGVTSLVQRRDYGSAPAAPPGGPPSKSQERAMLEGESVLWSISLNICF